MAHPRRDGYGHPLPELTDARREVLLQRPHNQAVRKLLFQLLEQQLQALCRRGTYADVFLRFSVQDGMLQVDGEEQVIRKWRYVEEEP